MTKERLAPLPEEAWILPEKTTMCPTCGFKLDMDREGHWCHDNTWVPNARLMEFEEWLRTKEAKGLANLVRGTWRTAALTHDEMKSFILNSQAKAYKRGTEYGR